MADQNADSRGIGAIDRDLVALLAERADALHEAIDGEGTVPLETILRWEHEQRRLVESVVADDTIRQTILNVMAEVRRGSRRALVLPTRRVACLGPEGTYTHIMALKLFGDIAEYELPPSIDEVIDLVAIGRCDYGLVAVANTIYGPVTENLESLLAGTARGVRACGEQELPVELTLMGRGKLEDLRTVYSHHQALGQCRRSIEQLRRELAERGLGHRVETVEVASTGVAARLVSADTSRRSAAVVHRLVGQGRGLEILRDPFEDEPGNATRFVVVTAVHDLPPPTGDDRTSIFLGLRNDNLPGQLLEALGVLREQNISLILSYPKHPRGRQHFFFIEFEGHRDDPPVRESLMRLGAQCGTGYPCVLGSYPRTVGCLGSDRS